MTYTEEEKNLIVLDSFESLTYNLKEKLLKGLTVFCPDFNELGESLINGERFGVYNKIKEQFFDENYRREVLQALDKKGILAVTYFSENYPKSLKRISSAPLVLYCRGNVKLLKTRMFAIVGSRRTPAGFMKICTTAAEEISRKFTVVSGIADGADSAALEGAAASGNVVSVLAYGMDHIYPSISRDLLNRVQSRGLVISEYRPEVQPRSFLFPARNRIIAALAEGVLVISAGEKSGALITADYAEKFGKPVFALPHNAGAACGAGCNKLIKNGARLAECGGDVLEYYGMDAGEQDLPPLTEGESAVLRVIAELGEAHVETIAERLGKKPYLIMGELTSLEIKKAITRLGGNRYLALRGAD